VPKTDDEESSSDAGDATPPPARPKPKNKLVKLSSRYNWNPVTKKLEG